MAPRVQQHAGEITNGVPLTIWHLNLSGTIYTLDGSDPRAVGGNVSDSVIAYAGPLLLVDNAQVKARVLIGSVQIGSDGSTVTDIRTRPCLTPHSLLQAGELSSAPLRRAPVAGVYRRPPR